MWIYLPLISEYVGGDYPKRTVSVLSRNINISTVSALAAFLVTKDNAKQAITIAVANIVVGTNLPSVHYTVDPTTWRTNDITYVGLIDIEKDIQSLLWAYIYKLNSL